MKNILVPCDFSKPAINAYRFALDIATQSKGTVHLLNVVELPVMHDTVLMPVLSFEAEFLKDQRQTVEARLNKISHKYKRDGVKVVTRTDFGGVARMILDYTIKKSIDIVLMGSHGASGLRELLIGSNAEKIVRKSAVPVLVIKDYFKGSIRNIVFPNTLDNTNQQDLITKVKALQHFFKARLHLVWINTPRNFQSDTLAHEKMEAFAKHSLLTDYTINVFNYTDEEGGIREFANSINGDLIAIATHGRTGISHFLNGSLAEDVVNHYKGLVWTYSLKNEPVRA